MSRAPAVSAYADPRYADTLAHVGRVRHLSRSGASLLVRAIEVPFAAADACGAYPLFAVEDWDALAADLTAQRDLLSFVAVVDPLAAPAPDTLARVFPDHRVAFKQHHVAELDPRAPLAHVHAEHRRKARAAARRLELRWRPGAQAASEDWLRLYGALRDRHGFAGLADLPGAALAAQLALPGMYVSEALDDGQAVSMSLWYVRGALAHYHLGASDARGYAARASYAAFAAALEQLAALGVTTVDLGGAAGTRDQDNGLSRFKRGWANTARTAWLGGRVLDAAAYARLTRAERADDYFPAYRRVAA